MARSRFCGHKDKIVTKEQESFYAKTEVQPRVQDRGGEAGHRTRVGVAQAARDLDLAEGQLRRWMRELTVAPQGAFPGNGQQRADMAEIAALKKEVAKLKAERGSQRRACVTS